MSKQIWKWRLEGSIKMPVNAKILCVQLQNGIPCIWAMVDPLADKETRHFEIYGTGWPITDSPGKYIGTVQNDAFVWHVFEMG